MAISSFDVVPITRENFMDVWEVYKSNPGYFLENYDKAVEPSDILTPFERLVEGYDPANQFYAGLWLNGRPVAVIELLPDFPEKGVLWFSEIIVRGDLQRQGFGRCITEAVVSSCSNFTQIRLGTDEHLIAFWQKLGFERVPRDDEYILMQKISDF